MDLEDVEGSLQKVYQEQIGRRREIGLGSQEIPSSDIPERLVAMSDEQVTHLKREVVVRETVPECLLRVSKKRKISGESSDEEEEEEKRTWRPSGRSKEQETETPQVVSMFDLPSEDENEAPAGPSTSGRVKPKCPVYGCEVYTRKLRNHVNRFHLPKLMWDNHQPPVRPDKENDMNELRYQVLQFLASKLIGRKDLERLLDWCTEQHIIPQRSVNTRRQIEQMRSLTKTMKWEGPWYNRYVLHPPSHISVLLHWRYQVGMFKRLSRKEAEEYVRLGIDFMNEPDNFLIRRRSNRSGETILSRSLHDKTISKTISSWDQKEDIRIVVNTQEENNNLVTMDICGKPDDSGVIGESHDDNEKVITMDECGDPDETSTIPQEDTETRVVTIGEATYTLGFKGSSLDIISDHRRIVTCSEPTRVPDNRWRTFEVFDSHLHLDRTSKRLLGNYSLTLEEWLQEPMERPPSIPVNVIGGTLIFCDPETYPTSVPVDDRWRIAVGVHPKNIGRTLNPAQKDRFLELIQSERVTAIGEVGIDRTVKGKYWNDQVVFLKELLPEVRKLGKPLILHIRSLQSEPFYQSTFMIALELCSEFLIDTHKIILHCFTSTKEVVEAWLFHFPNTYFGITYYAAYFKSEQRQALRAIPNNRLLVETDSPYIAPKGISNNSPIYLGEVINEVARIRDQTVEEVCRWTTSNATVFGLPM